MPQEKVAPFILLKGESVSLYLGLAINPRPKTPILVGLFNTVHLKGDILLGDKWCREADGTYGLQIPDPFRKNRVNGYGKVIFSSPEGNLALTIEMDKFNQLWDIVGRLNTLRIYPAYHVS